MKVLLTGAQGQVGQEITPLALRQGWQILALERAALDITDPQAVRKTVTAFQPQIVLNCAAYTAVDLAESQPQQAFAVNRDGARHLAATCAEIGCPLLHISTDYVFDGTQSDPYPETAPPGPLGVYGASKWAGEEAIRAAWSNHLIVRVSWVFGFHGKNFVKTILRLAAERETLAVVADQYGGPTPAVAIADMMLNLARQALAPGFGQWGTCHYQGWPVVSWHDFAQAIVATAREQTRLPLRELRPIPTRDYPTPAQRPAHAILDCQRIRDQLGIDPPDWRPILNHLIPRLLP
ncbi:MAG: dTDP-4-dehydrorhamnose reductase [Magnetococcales bacterium]|nr:dTDP-4-dehydrorhamnose reductase [Magnetococcales bacterium]